MCGGRRAARFLDSRGNRALSQRPRALSSAGEHTLHTGGVVGSIPTAPTILSGQPACGRGLSQILFRRLADAAVPLARTRQPADGRTQSRAHAADRSDQARVACRCARSHWPIKTRRKLIRAERARQCRVPLGALPSRRRNRRFRPEFTASRVQAAGRRHITPQGEHHEVPSIA
jgi:hypothetical protein